MILGKDATHLVSSPVAAALATWVDAPLAVVPACVPPDPMDLLTPSAVCVQTQGG